MKNVLLALGVLMVSACTTAPQYGPPPGPPHGYPPQGPQVLPPSVTEFNGHRIASEPQLERCRVDPPPHDSREAAEIDRICGAMLWGSAY